MDTIPSKQSQLLTLAKQRQDECLPPHFNLKDVAEEYYECDHVSPWTKSARNVNASIMLIGQDWSSTDELSKTQDAEQKLIGQKWSLPSNRNIRDLLSTHFGMCFCETYATNVFPFIKRGSLSQRIDARDLKYCAQKYALPQVWIVKPRIVLCLGKMSFDSIREALALPGIEWKVARAPNGHTTRDGIEFYGLPHPGGHGVRNVGGMRNMHDIWRLIALRWKTLI